MPGDNPEPIEMIQCADIDQGLMNLWFRVYEGWWYENEPHHPKVVISGVRIVVWALNVDTNEWYQIRTGMTDATGRKKFTFNCTDLPLNMKFTFSKDDYITRESGNYYVECTGIGQDDQGNIIYPGNCFSFDVALYRTEVPDPIPRDDARFDWRDWDKMFWLERLALSFIIALSLLKTADVIQGFSMEKWNPVA